MPGTIKAKINDDLAYEFFEFTVAGYGRPVEVVRRGFGVGYVQRFAGAYSYPLEEGDPVWYLNTAGFAQRLDEKRPPFSNNSVQGIRLLLIPNFDEAAVLAMLAARHLGD